jgi:hypothetical protein
MSTRQAAILLWLFTTTSSFGTGLDALADEVPTQKQDGNRESSNNADDAAHLEEMPRDSSEARQAADAVLNCEKVFGKSVNFRDRKLSAVLAFVAPAPFQERQSLEGKLIDERLREWQRESFTRDWFARNWLPHGQAPEPVAFRFRSPDQRLIDSTLYYKWKINSVIFRVTETSSGALVEIADPDFDLVEGVPREKFEKLLKQVFRIPEFRQKEIGSGEFVPVDLAGRLKMPRAIRDGTIFGSLNDPRHMNRGFRKWYDATMGFATGDAICIVVWRPNRLGHLGQKGRVPRWSDDSGHFEDPTWLDGEIFEADGKTRLKVPSLLPTSPK